MIGMVPQLMPLMCKMVESSITWINVF